jgi:tripartite ATP-independent transporter DctP family solute receptor
MNYLQKNGVICSFLLTACMVSSAQTVLQFGHTDQAAGARDAAANFFARSVEQLTQGRYIVEVLCCGKAGNDPKSIERLVGGDLDFTVSATGSYAAHVPTLNLTMLPFLVDNYAQGWKLYDESPWMQAQFAKAPAKGFRFLATWEAGFRSMTTKGPLNSPDDARGQKLRTFPNEMMRWTLEAIGFNIQIMPLPEVYEAIKHGVVSGQENPIDTIYSNKFYEVAPHVTLTNHVYSPLPLAVSEKTWQKMSSQDQRAVADAAIRTANFSRIHVVGNDDIQLKKMEKLGAKIQRSPNTSAFRTASQVVYAKARDKYGTDVDQLLEQAKNVRKKYR